MCVGVAVGVCGAGRGRGCVLGSVLAWTSWSGRPVVAAGSWAWVPWGMVVWRPLCFGFPVCVPASGHPMAFGYRGTGQGVLSPGGRWQWWRGACVVGRGSPVWVASCVVAAVWVGALGAWVGWLDVGVRVAVLLVWAVLGVLGWPLLCEGQFVLAGEAWLVAWCSTSIAVLGLAGSGGWGWVSGVCVRRLRGGSGRDAAGDASSDGEAGDTDGQGAAGDATGDRAAGDADVRVLQVMRQVTVLLVLPTVRAATGDVPDDGAARHADG